MAYGSRKIIIFFTTVGLMTTSLLCVLAVSLWKTPIEGLASLVTTYLVTVGGLGTAYLGANAVSKFAIRKMGGYENEE